MSDTRIIAAIEHETIALNFDDLFADGRLNIFEGISKLVQISFRKGAPSIQLGKYLGYLPINNRIAVQVGTRVPVRNLERILSLAGDCDPLLLAEHERFYTAANDRPPFLATTIGEQFLVAVERVIHEGLWLDYKRQERVGSFPAGRIAAFESAWRTHRSGRPTAVSSYFNRELETEANGVISLALRKVRELVLNTAGDFSLSPNALSRLSRCESEFRATRGQVRALSAQAVERIVQRIPQSRPSYRRAVRLASLIVSDAGVSIRDLQGEVELPSILIDMENAFEAYIRRVLGNRLSNSTGLTVLDGTKGPPFGAKKPIFSEAAAGAKNPYATPDIVIQRQSMPALIIDAKYKPLDDLPDRQDRNQVTTYGACYGCDQVALM